MEMVFPDGSNLFQQDNILPQSKNGSGVLKEYNNDFDVLTWPPNSSDYNQIPHQWDVLNKQM